MASRSFERRLRALERQSGGMWAWPSQQRHCELVARWIESRRAPDHPEAREILCSGVRAIMRGLQANDRRPPQALDVRDLLALYTKGGACEPVYLDMPGPPEQPDPLPKLWQPVENDLAVIEAMLVRPLPDVDLSMDLWAL